MSFGAGTPVAHDLHRKRGLIINMASFSGGSVASPMLSTYAGTKAFVSSFSGSLAEEVRDKGIDVECVNTYFVVRFPRSFPVHGCHLRGFERRSRICRRSAAQAHSSRCRRPLSAASSRSSPYRAVRSGRIVPASSPLTGAMRCSTTSWCAPGPATVVVALLLLMIACVYPERDRLEHGVRPLHAPPAQGHPPSCVAQDGARGEAAVSCKTFCTRLLHASTTVKAGPVRRSSADDL